MRGSRKFTATFYLPRFGDSIGWAGLRMLLPETLAMLQWKEDYSTGVALIDSQHKALFDHINKLEQMLAVPNVSKTEASLLINFMVNYAKGHFAFEESCMNRYHCPNHETNKQAHAAFMQAAEDYKAKLEKEGVSKQLLTDLHKTVSTWITGHILKIDVKLREVAPKAETH